MKQGLLSVIVPVYNASASLQKCVESIINQTYKELEIILVDDGSTDDSGAICESLVKRDIRVKVCHTANHGSMAARNHGVELAQGRMITFVDSDDWIEADMYSHMISMYGRYEVDMISSGLIFDYTNGIRTMEYDLIPEGVYDKIQIEHKIIPVMMYDAGKHRRAVTPSVCTKIINKDLWREVLQRSDSRITYGEDAAISYLCLAKSERAAFTNRVWYHYCVRNDSMVHSFHIHSFEEIKIFADYMENAFREQGIWDQMKVQLKEYIKYFLYPAIDAVYSIKLGEPVYLFPYELVKAGSRVVIYGAGKIGRAYRKNLEKTNYALMEAWVDRAYKKYSSLGEKISDPAVISKLCFDYIVIAIENDEIAKMIRADLMNAGISGNKIVWKKPESIEGD